jgi:hypothetical protein
MLKWSLETPGGLSATGIFGARTSDSRVTLDFFSWLAEALWKPVARNARRDQYRARCSGRIMVKWLLSKGGK